MLKVAMLSKWHVHAEGYARQLLQSGKVQITAVWDDDVLRGAEWAQRLNADFESDLDKLLARSDVEAVVCNAPTTAHRDIIIAAAKAGKHIFTEKALAPTMAECHEIKEAIESAGVTFVISYPMLGTDLIQFAKREIDAGTFGQVSLIRIRNGHNGVSGNWLPAYWFEKKDAAGGAMVDLGCHPMYTLAYLCGKPKRITALFNAPLGSSVDENAAASIEFDNGTIGIAETSFISFRSPAVLEIYGTDATLISIDGDTKFYSKKFDGYVADGFVRPPLPKSKPSPLSQFVDACINKTAAPKELDIDAALALTELLEGAYIADEKVK